MSRTPVWEESLMAQDRPLAVVTGGSSGIGLELARQCAQHGFDVAVSGSSEKVDAAAASLRELGVDAWAHRADASTYEKRTPKSGTESKPCDKGNKPQSTDVSSALALV